MKSFRASPSWATYRTILAEDFGLSLTQEPVESFRPVRGHNIRVDEWLPSGEAKGTLVMVHGGGGNGRILAPIAEPMAQSGWRVIAPDLPGYGLTEPARSYHGDYSEWPKVVSEIAEAEPRPVVLMGLSMGGLTALLAAQRSKNVCALIVTTLLDLSDPEVFVRAARWRWLGRLSLLTMTLAPWLFDRVVMPLSLATPLEKMSSSKRMQAYFQKDPLIGGSWKAARFFRSIHQHRVHSWSLHCPLLLAHPGADAWTPTAMSLGVYEKVMGPKRVVELSNGSHLPAEQPAAGELHDAMCAFLDDVAASSSTSSSVIATQRSGYSEQAPSGGLGPHGASE
jgi:alpha-beta hydrolase superfamily lysophospholipase